MPSKSCSKLLLSINVPLIVASPMYVFLAQTLSNIPFPGEIYKALRDLPSLKAPGLDGFHALFFSEKLAHIGPECDLDYSRYFLVAPYSTNMGPNKFGPYP